MNEYKKYSAKVLLFAFIGFLIIILYNMYGEIGAPFENNLISKIDVFKVGLFLSIIYIWGFLTAVLFNKL
jgi:hypothetical protein